MPRVACSYMAYWFVNIYLPQPTKWNLKTQLLDVPDMKKKKKKSCRESTLSSTFVILKLHRTKNWFLPTQSSEVLTWSASPYLLQIVTLVFK